MIPREESIPACCFHLQIITSEITAVSIMPNLPLMAIAARTDPNQQDLAWWRRFGLDYAYRGRKTLCALDQPDRTDRAGTEGGGEGEREFERYVRYVAKRSDGEREREKSPANARLIALVARTGRADCLLAPKKRRCKPFAPACPNIGIVRLSRNPTRRALICESGAFSHEREREIARGRRPRKSGDSGDSSAGRILSASLRTKRAPFQMKLPGNSRDRLDINGI